MSLSERFVFHLSIVAAQSGLAGSSVQSRYKLDSMENAESQIKMPISGLQRTRKL